MATEGLLRRGGEHLQVWAGHAVYLLSLARPAMSILDSVYRFVEAAWGRRTPLWASVRQEMRDVRAMVWLAEAHLTAPFVPKIAVGDACVSGYAVCVKDACDGDLRAAWNWRELWGLRRVRLGRPAEAWRPSELAALGGLTAASPSEVAANASGKRPSGPGPGALSAAAGP